MKDMVTYASDKLREAERNGSDMDMRYWAAYLDGVRGTIETMTTQLTASEAARTEVTILEA